MPKGFQPPEGAAALKKPVEWDPEAIGKQIKFKKGISFKGEPEELRAYLHKRAGILRALFHKAGFLPYFDSENFDMIMMPYEYKGQPVLFAVNDKRQPYNKGVPNKVTFLVRDKSEGLKIIDIESGKEMKLTSTPDGQTFTDTLGPAFYGLYAVLKKGEAWKGPGPQPKGPAILNVKAARDAKAGGVRVSWGLPFKDWVGCDVARYRVYRSEGSAAPAQIADIHGRIYRGGGGVVTSFVPAASRRTECRSAPPCRCRCRRRSRRR